MALARAGIHPRVLTSAGSAAYDLLMPDEKNAYDNFKRLPYGDPGYELQQNEIISAVNMWNQTQRKLPGGWVFFDQDGLLIDYGTRIDFRPNQYKLIPITQDEKNKAERDECRLKLIAYGIRPLNMSDVEERFFQNMRDLDKKRKDRDPDSWERSRKTSIYYWNDYQAKLAPEKIGYYLTYDGKPTQSFPRPYFEVEK